MAGGHTKILHPLLLLLLIGLLDTLVQANNLPRNDDNDLLPYQTIRDGAPSPKTDAAATVLNILRRGYSCPAGSLPCLDGVGCCRFACCGSGCCLAGEFCYDEKAPAVCCRAYTEKRCTSGCIPFDATCCGGGKFVGFPFCTDASALKFPFVTTVARRSAPPGGGEEPPREMSARDTEMVSPLMYMNYSASGVRNAFLVDV